MASALIFLPHPSTLRMPTTKKPSSSRSTSNTSHQSHAGILAPTSRAALYSAATASACGWLVR
jgi:hypothetical protein